MDRVESLIAREEAKAFAAIQAYTPRLAGKKVLLITGGVKSWSVVAALQEAGMTIVGSSVKKSTKEDKERLKEMSPDVHQIDDLRPREMYKMLKDAQADIMLSGGRSQFVALKAKMPWLDINQERHYAYAGYVGIIELLRQRSRPYLFSNTLAPAIAGASLKVLELLGRSTALRDTLEANTKFFREGMTRLGFNILPGTHPICPVMLGAAALATRFADRMLEHGVYVIGFSYPVVPQGKARIRTQISAAHTREELQKALDAFAAVKRELEEDIQEREAFIFGATAA